MIKINKVHHLWYNILKKMIAHRVSKTTKNNVKHILYESLKIQKESFDFYILKIFLSPISFNIDNTQFNHI